jgi:hypothetical protein
MSTRVDILDAFYAHLANITVLNGYNYDWYSLKSIGNGSLAPKDDQANVNFSIGIETPSDEFIGSDFNSGQSKFYLSAPLYARAYFKYDELDIDSNDYYIEVVRSKMIEDIRTAFGLPFSGACTAGLNELVYVQEIEPEDVSGYTVTIQLEFQIRWYDDRRK